MARNEEVVIVGGGIAALSAALASARAGRGTLVLSGEALGGRLLGIETIDGFPGFPDGIPGYDLCPIVQEQAVVAGAGFTATRAHGLERHDGLWRVSTGDGEVSAPAVVIATGAELREPDIPGAQRLHGKGIGHCATCDGPLLRERVVGVVGGGDSALQEALTLARFAARVIVFHRGGALSAQRAYRERVARDPKIEVRLHTTVEAALGEPALSGVRTRTATDGSSAGVELAALFVYTGLRPNTDWLHGLLELDPAGRIRTDDLLRCRPAGLFAAGTVRSGCAGRAASAAGEGTAAALAADRHLIDRAWRE
jgi:thioredoxin reductase (NADPH)